MKKILSLLAVCMIFVGLASCGDDDDLKPTPNPGTGKDSTRTYLTPEERAAQLRDMQGVYKGWAYFKYNDYAGKYKDSAMVSATATSNDSLMVLKNLPTASTAATPSTSTARPSSPMWRPPCASTCPLAARPPTPTCLSTGSGSCPAARTTK